VVNDEERDVTRAGVLRLVSLNFWGTEAPLDRRLALAERQLRALAPDVIGMQEVRPLDGRSGRSTADVLAAALGLTVVYEPALRWADDELRPGMAGGEEGLAILSRYPVLERRVLPLPEARPSEARILLSARLDTEAGPIWVHTTHLHYRLDDGVAREAQVTALDAAIRACGRGNDDAPQLLCGDFNATADSDDAGRAAHPLPGRLAAPAPRARPRRRPGAGHHVVEREPAHAAAAVARPRPSHRLRVRHDAQEGRPRHRAGQRGRADRARGRRRRRGLCVRPLRGSRRRRHRAAELKSPARGPYLRHAVPLARDRAPGGAGRLR
jgi:endonuclease/exonuclease/phosphatase family metal-dependent hydrolase